MHTIRTAALLALALSVPLACAVAAPGPAQEPAPAPSANPDFDAIHATWTEVLAKHAKGADFDYAGLKAGRARLDAYVAALEKVKPAEFAALSKKERFAFWVNAYNAWTVKRVVDAYPIETIKSLGDEKASVWDRELVPLGHLAPKLGKTKLTLNDVEHEILRAEFADPRVHAAVNCASKGCPALRPEAYSAKQLDAQLDEQVKAWLADATKNRFDRAQNRMDVSQIFEWFAEDFAKPAGSPAAWIAKYRPADAEWLGAKPGPKVAYVPYDWALNDARR
jgi:hypothetical protein